MLLCVRKRLNVLGLALPILILPISQAAKAVAQQKEITNSISMKLALIPSGKFIMGSPRDEKGRDADENQHEVAISKPFYLGVHTVTVGQFQQFVKNAGYKTDAEKDQRGGRGYDADKKDLVRDTKYNWQNVGWQQKDEYPVVNVTWNDAAVFCEWLSRKEGQEYRLPTEAEWEYSCRAGTRTRFYSGDEDVTLRDVANVADASLKQIYPKASWLVMWDDGYAFTAPVGGLKPNAFGLYDMHGNVEQWCQDWYGDYPHGPISDPQGPRTGKGRVMRGGSFAAKPSNVRSACRNAYAPSGRDANTGFRVARALAP